MNRKFIYTCLLLVACGLQPQVRLPHLGLENPAIQGINMEIPHATFYSFENRELALINNRLESSRFIMLNGDSIT